jgi:putative ABC transport system ATP-binding protein
MAAIEAVGLCRAYGERKVLEDFSISVGEGRFEALMGPSGSGKSTFLHLAAGLIAADAGTILVGGEDVTKMSDSAAARFRRRRVGVVFQAFNLLPDRTVRENIALPLKLDGRRLDEDRYERLVGLLGLKGRDSARTDALSGGEQQRVAIARALIASPAVVLADEPTGNLDTESAKAICSLLKELNKTENCAILVVTHDPVVAACASRVNFLKNGKITASCEPCGNPALVSARYLEACR